VRASREELPTRAVACALTSRRLELESIEVRRPVAQREIMVAGQPVLRQKSKRIKTFGPSIESLVADMVDTMRAADGLGLAAPQIGVPLRVIVIETPAEHDEEGNEVKTTQMYVYCNPEIIAASGEEEDEEGCLSVPGYVGAVKRATNITVKGQDAKGRQVRTKAEALLARAFQHETDHLDGILFIDRVDSLEKLRLVKPKAEGAGTSRDEESEQVTIQQRRRLA